MPASAIAEAINRSVGGNSGSGGYFDGGGAGSPDGRAPERVYITGMLIALGAILMFFSAFVSAWVVRRGFSTTDWQPMTLPPILWLNTLVLAASAVTLWYSRRCWRRGNEADHRYWWGLTTVLGVAFLVGQLLAWRQMCARGFLLSTSPSASFFYVFTAAHALHVLGGVAALVALAVGRPRRLSRATATGVAALYWDFLGALWLVLFAVLLRG